MLRSTTLLAAGWLRRYTDEEIAAMAEALFGHEADLERIASERERLAVALALPPALEP
jgi:hypothetical protein